MWLGDNQLTTLDPRLFADLVHLRDLSLSDNQLTTLDPRLFTDFVHLHGLGLRGNGLTCLAPDLFRRLTRLCALDLSYNRLGNVAPVFFRDQGLIHLRALTLGPAEGQYSHRSWSMYSMHADEVPSVEVTRYVASAPCLEALTLTADISLSYPVCGAPSPAPSAPRAVRFARADAALQVGRRLVAETIPVGFARADWHWESCADAAGRDCRDLAPPICTPNAARPRAAHVYVPAIADEGRYLRASLPYLTPDGTWTRLRTPLVGPVKPDDPDDAYQSDYALAEPSPCDRHLWP